MPTTPWCPPPSGVSPFMPSLGYQPPLFPHQEEQVKVPSIRANLRGGVWLSSWDLPLQVESRKLSPRFIGPFEVDRMVNSVAACLRLPASLRVHPTFHVSQVKPNRESILSSAAEEPPRVRFINGQPAYTVQRILDVHCRGRDW